jgi:hypothetical protein|tara:strand:- start:2757 stop:3281 length:525 start_codon:yes stop_codon:yes gene_type:complete
MKNKTIATTRFNNETHSQNTNYKQKSDHTGCIYGTPMKIKEKIPLHSYVYVIEMNNDKNKIEGIGLIKNERKLDKNYRIYKNMDYNRYVYTGDKYLPITKVTDEYHQQVILVMEQLIFKGDRHCKRGQGITQLPQWILQNKTGFDFVKCFDDMFNNVNMNTITNKQPRLTMKAN